MTYSTPPLFRPTVWNRIRDERYFLQCHFDINGVILGQESREGGLTPPKEYASIMLAKGTYSQWMPNQSSKSFKAHVWENLHPGPNSDLNLRKARKEALKQFVPTLANIRHPLAQKVNRQYENLVSTLQKSPIFPGFPRLIQTLRENEVPHNFIFRTFGGDGEFIKKYLEETFPDMQLQYGKFDEDGAFHTKKEDQEEMIQDPHQFRERIRTGHWLIQDNFKRWSKGGEQGNFGKLFPFSSDPQDRVLSLFADDNLEIVSSGNQRTILCCYDTASKVFVSTQQASSRLIQVNPIEAALNPDYLTARVCKTAEALLPPQTLFQKISSLVIAALAADLIF